jgi:predicted nicotinamide N-methyase
MDPRAAFIAAQTALASPPLVPEIQLYLASEVTPLWEATEVTLAASYVPPPYWAFAWPGGQALARHVLDHPQLVAGRRVLDFAAGSGLAAIAAARAGAASVAAAEIDPIAIAAIDLNATINAVEIDCIAEDIVGTDDGWHVVLAGDVCYERPMAERATAWLVDLARRGAIVLLGDPGRAYLPRTGLDRVTCYTVPTTLDLEDRTERETTIWRVLSG